MTIEQTAPIHDLDRLLDALALNEPDLPESAWGPTLGRLATLDDALAPRGDALRLIRRRLMSDAGVPAGRDEPPGRAAPTAAAGPRALSAATPGRWVERRAYHAVAAAAMLLVAVGSVWFGRGVDRTLPDAAPSVAQVGSDLAPGGSAPPGPTGAVSSGRSGVDAIDVARASIGGFGSADLVGLLAIEADAGRRDFVARDQRRREGAASWTDLVQERDWAAIVRAASPNVPTSGQPTPISAV